MSTDDSLSPEDSTPTPDEGLLEFYSAEANALLTQYRRVDFLLGPDTHDHTHSGTLCEVLLRDYLRRVLLPWMGVDKGFIYGRSEDDSRVETSNEIDILVHDQREYRPIFRMEDFVIVQPEAVLAVVQVKKRINTSGANPLRKGLQNVIGAKRHVITQLRRNHADPRLLEQKCRRLVSAVVGFDSDTTTAETFWRYLDAEFENNSDFVETLRHEDIPARIYSMPHFVGALNGRVCQRGRYDAAGLDYRCFSSSHDGKNIAGQMLADIFSKLLWGGDYGDQGRPPFQYPVGLEHESKHRVEVSGSDDTTTS